MIPEIETEIVRTLKGMIHAPVVESTGAEIEPPAVVVDFAGTSLEVKAAERGSAGGGFLATVYDRLHNFEITIYSARGKDYSDFEATLNIIFNGLPRRLYEANPARGYHWEDIEPDERDETADRNTRSITLPLTVTESGVALTG